MAPTPSPDPDHDWPVVESAAEYHTGWYLGGYDRVEQPDGSEKRYYWAELPPAVVVVAVTDAEEVVFVDQYRPAIREQCLELPAGIVEPDDDPDATGDEFDDQREVTPAAYETAGGRELREETGFVADDVTLLEEFWVATGVLRHRRGIVFADGLAASDPDLDDNEFLSVRTIPVAEALATARREPANDATIEGILLAKAENRI